VWERTSAEIEFGAFQPYNLTSGGIKFTNFPENQLTTVFVKLLIRQPPDLPNLFLRPCQVGPRNRVLRGNSIPPGKGHFSLPITMYMGNIRRAVGIFNFIR